MKTLYYTLSFDIDLKTIRVYTIEDNLLKVFCTIEAYMNSSSEEEIQWYLDNNGYGDDEFNFEHIN